jgi:hypothetical protein
MITDALLRYWLHMNFGKCNWEILKFTATAYFQ